MRLALAAFLPLFIGAAGAVHADGAGGSMQPPSVEASAAADEDETDSLEATPQAEEALSGATLPPPVAQQGRTMCDRLRDLTAQPLKESEHRLTLRTLEMLRCPRPAAAGPSPSHAGAAGTPR